MSYLNPIIPGFNPDPSIIQVDGVFYLATSTFEYFPGIPIYESTDLVHWTLISHALTRRSQLTLWSVLAGGGMYAPSLRYHRGRYYMISSCVYRTFSSPLGGGSAPRSFYVWTDDIRKVDSWSEPIYFDVTGIDQDIFFDDATDKTYLLCSSSRHVPGATYAADTVITEVDLASGRSLSPTTVLRRSDRVNKISEGAHIFRRGDYLYLLSAEGGTEDMHQEWVFRSRNGVQGPWETGTQGEINPLVFNGQHPHVRATGHMDMVEGPDGRWWAVLLAYRPQRDENGGILPSQLGRETFLAPVEWIDDWPVVNKRKSIELVGLPEVDLPRKTPVKEVKLTFTPDKNIHLDGWYHLRTPVKKEYDLSLRPGSIALFGGPYTYNNDECPTMLLQKQPDFCGLWTCDIDFQPARAGEEAFTTVWWSRFAFASLGVRGLATATGSHETSKEIVFRHALPDSDDFKTTTVPVDHSAIVRVEIQAQSTGWQFNYTFLQPDGRGDRVEAGWVPSTAIVRQRPHDSAFTGTHLGIYAAGVDHSSSLNPAFFSGLAWSL